MSFSSRCGGRPLRLEADPRTSRLSDIESDWNETSATSYEGAYRRGDPRREGRTCSGQLGKICRGKSALDGSEVLFHFPRPQPGQGSDDQAGRSSRRDKLPARAMTQADGQRAKLQRSARSRGEVDQPYRDLCRQTENVRRRSPAGDDRFSPQLSQSGNDGSDSRCPNAESGLYRSDVYAPEDPEQLPSASEARQGLIDGGTVAQVEQGVRADRRALG